MAYRILIQVALFLLPFALFGLYRLLAADAKADGRKTWPITSLFCIGAALAAGVWIYFIAREPRDPNKCYEPARFEDGVLIPAREYECDPNIEDVGAPRSDQTGGERGSRPAADPDG
ncbi:MAG: DUF6111 family protein [Pseudomonadota bacterium]